jgi:DNA segregation ATPase FtsK/SpoIIIE-like protein
MTPQTYIERPPRIEPELPAGNYTIPNPPDTEVDPARILQEALLPLLMITGYFLAAIFGQGRNMLMMVPMLISIVGAVALSIYAHMKENEKMEEAKAAYKRRLGELRRKMESEHEEQRIYYFYNYPNPQQILQIAQDLSLPAHQQQQNIRSGTRLWERRPSDHDFLYLRLGLGARQSTVVYKISENEKPENPLMREATRLAEDSRLLYSVPLTVPLYRSADETEQKKVEKKHDQQGEEGKAEQTQEAKGATVRHSIGITGNDSEKVYSYLRTLLLDYAAFHSPQDTTLYVAGGRNARQHWRWAYDLPHCKESDKTETLRFESEQKPDENEIDPMRQFWKNLRTLLERRRMRLQDKENGTDVRLPFILVVVDVLQPVPDWSSLHDLESEAAISTILMDGQKLGAGILFLTAQRSKIPSRCAAAIEVDQDENNSSSAIFRYAETGFNSIRYVGNAPLIDGEQDARNFSRALEPIDVRRGYGASLAATVTLMEMLNTHTLEELRAFARDNWRRSLNPETADWLHTAIGLLSGNEPRVLTFSAKADGVHGIIAGSTGSGKSELLMTLIIGLALNYSPDVLNFVLVDYKGGSAFEPFKKLPHAVDIVTNLDQSATARVFASIIAELDRRQRLNTFTNSKDIVHYRRRGLNLDPERPPYPHLFIIIDEFAEMISGNAEYKAQLESITRLGRALGVTLILAAQRPVGVTDQMRANIKFRICLRVETPDDSREVLRRSDAAFLPPGIPGRGYLQIGNENIEMIQTAYTGGDYKGPQEETRTPNVEWLGRKEKSPGQKSAEPPKLYDVIVEMLNNLSVEDKSQEQWRPWPAFLPMQQVGKQVLTLQTPLDADYIGEDDQTFLRSAETDALEELSLNEQSNAFVNGEFDWQGVQWGKKAMRPLIGLVDNPYLAVQKPLLVNFPNGHAVVFGASGRGKTTFLRTVISSLVLTHSPDELHIYILDFGGRALSVFSDLPHVGAVITAEEDERVQRVLRKVSEVIDARQILFSEAKVNSLDSYNQANPHKRLPAVLVLMDNFAEFKEYHEPLMSPLMSLIRESRAYGVHFLFSAESPNALGNKLFSLVTERFTLKLTDPSEYTEIVGRGVPADLSPVPGRGYVRVGNMPLEFQTALAFEPTESDPDALSKISKTCLHLKDLWGESRWRGEKPSSIETLPVRYSLENILAQIPTPDSRRMLIPIGIDDRTLAPALLDMERQGPHLVVIGQPFSGKTTTLRAMILSTAWRYSPDEVMMVLVDYSRKLWRGGETSLADLPHVVQTVEDLSQLDDLYTNLAKECAEFETNPKRRKIILFIDNYDAFTEESSRKNPGFFEQAAALLRKYQTSGVYMVVAGSLAMMSATDDLRRIFAAPNFGIALRSADAVNRLNGRFPRSLAEVELPMGRGFIVRTGITNMLQIATPYLDDETEPALDSWVRKIHTRYPQENITWQTPTPEAPSRPATISIAPVTATQTEYDIPALKQTLLEQNFPEALLSLLSVDDIIKTAREMKILPEESNPNLQGDA